MAKKSISCRLFTPLGLFSPVSQLCSTRCVTQSESLSSSSESNLIAKGLFCISMLCVITSEVMIAKLAGLLATE